MSSLMVPYGATVQLFKSNAFIGEPLTIVGKPLKDDRLEMSCINISDIDPNYDEEISSIKVSKTDSGVTKGMWRQIAGTNNLNIAMEVGFETKN